MIATPRGPAGGACTLSPGSDSALSPEDRTTEDPPRWDVSADVSIPPSSHAEDAGPSRCRPLEWVTRPVHPSPHSRTLYRPNGSHRAHVPVSRAHFPR